MLFRQLGLQLNFLHWINCDSYEPGPFTDFTVDLQNLKDFTDIYAYLIFKNRSVVQLDYDAGSGNYSNNNIPVGTECTLLMIAAKKNILYANFTPLTISGSMQVFPPLSQTNEAKLIADIMALD